MVDTGFRAGENPSSDDNPDDQTWPSASSVSPDRHGNFANQLLHQRDLVRRWRKLSIVGVAAAGAWLGWSALVRAGAQNGLDDAAKDEMHQAMVRIEAPLALAILAVIATLTVAVSVIVRGLSDPESDSSQGIDEARRQFLTAAVSVLGVLGIVIAVLAVAWNAGSGTFGLPSAVGLLLIAAVIAAIAADSGTVLGRARSSNPAFARWLREEEVRRLLGLARTAHQELSRVDRRSRLVVLATTAALLAASGIFLGMGLLVVFPGDLIHTIWSIPDRLWRSGLAGLFIGGGLLSFGYRISVHWLLRKRWSAGLWMVLSMLFVAAVVWAALSTIGSNPGPVSWALPAILIGGPGILAGLILALNFGPVRLNRDRRHRRFVPDLRLLRGGYIWRRIDTLRKANLTATSEPIS